MQYKTYPLWKEFRSGVKVCWRYYETEAEAKACAEVAMHNAIVASREGYDFGYQSPGTIMRPTLQNWHPGLYEVCCP